MAQESFLKDVAKHYLRDTSVPIWERVFIFPSKRAKTFFLRSLSELSEAPVLAPRCTTVNEFILGLCPTQEVQDRTALLFELYRIYKEINLDDNVDPLEEDSFDEFLFWGDTMLKDFDQIDRYLVDANQLYGNVEALKELENVDYDHLSDELKSLLALYWEEFAYKLKNSQARLRFIRFWRLLVEMYRRFSETCDEQCKTYEGRIYRKVAESCVDIIDDLVKANPLGREGVASYVFVGLFELSPSEKKLFKQMSQRHIAEFVFDEDVCVVRDPYHPASRVLASSKEYLKTISLSERLDGRPQDFLPQDIHVYKCVSTMTQIKLLPTLLQELGTRYEDALGLNTAIVLADEQLLLPVVSSIPPRIEGKLSTDADVDKPLSLNITLGYPLNKTSIAILLNRWMSLLMSSYKGAYSVSGLINLLTIQTILGYFPGLNYIVKALRTKKAFMLDATWILNKLVEEARKFAPQGEEDKSNQELLEAKEFLALLLLPEEQVASASLGKPTSALEFLEQHLIKILDKLSVCMIEALMPQGEQSENLFTDADSTQNKVHLSFDLNFLKHYQEYVEHLLSLVKDERYQSYDMNRESAMRLLDGLTQGHTIPFKGDPLEGLQIIGVLESRSLSFEHLIYVSAQEGKLPKSKGVQTLIPFKLREEFGLPNPNDIDTYDAYRFYQNIARSKSLHLIYSLNDALGGKGELTRYFDQIEKLYVGKESSKRINIHKYSVNASLGYRDFTLPMPEVAKNGNSLVEERLSAWSRGEAHLSPSSFNLYLQCPLHFYYRYIERLKEEESAEALLQNNDFGTILHGTLEQIYNEMRPQKSVKGDFDVTKALLNYWINSPSRIQNQVRAQYELLLKAKGEVRADISSYDAYNIEIISQYVRNVLELDRQISPFYYHSSEENRELAIPINDDTEVFFKGIIDRVDHINDVGLRLVDYKTGSDELGAFDIIKIDENPKKYKAIIQILLYCEMYMSGNPYNRDKTLEERRAYKNPYRDAKLTPALYLTKEIAEDIKNYDPYLKRDKESVRLSYQDVREEYMSYVSQKLSELYNMDYPFRATEDVSNCSLCSFVRLCRRELYVAQERH